MSVVSDLYMFEDAWEKAVSLWLNQNGINDPAKQRDSKLDVDGRQVTLKTPRVEVQFLFGGFGREHYHINSAGRWLDLGDGVGYLTIVTNRLRNDESHSQLRGLCRSLMQHVGQISGKMTNHIIEKMIEDGSTMSFQPDKNHDISKLQFKTTMRIIGTKFPTS